MIIAFFQWVRKQARLTGLATVRNELKPIGLTALPMLILRHVVYLTRPLWSGLLEKLYKWEMWRRMRGFES